MSGMDSFTFTGPASVTVNLNQSTSVALEMAPLTSVLAATRLFAVAGVPLDSVSWVMGVSGGGVVLVMAKTASLVSETVAVEASLTRTLAVVVTVFGTVQV